MHRAGTAALLTLCLGSAFAQQSRELVEDSLNRRTAKPNVNTAVTANWNPESQVLFKGTIRGVLESSVRRDGQPWVSLLVKLSNGGTALVELGPKNYVDAQSMRLRMRAPIWVAGSKVFAENGDSMILAERVRFDEMRPAFRTKDGKPFWEK